MIPLPKETKKDGMKWRFVQRRGDWALYSQEIAPGQLNYQVFKVLKAPDGEINGVKIHARELFPAPSQYGVYAWNFMNLASAIQKFNEVTNG